MKHISYNSINQFRYWVTHFGQGKFLGMENGEPLYDTECPKPIIKFTGTVKLHGTNGSVVYNNGKITYQSRNDFVTIGNDNYGFAAFCSIRDKEFREIFDQILKKNPTDNPIVIFGEYVGKGIQSGVAISNLDKSFFIFDVYTINTDLEELPKEHIDCEGYRYVDSNIYNINDFKKWELNIDFNDPESAAKALEEISLQVESECPVAKSLGHSGIGEGVVWKGYYENQKLVFKVKGQKHSVVKTKEKVPIDVEKLNSANEFIEYAVTEARVDQGISTIPNVSIKDMGTIIQWVVTDIFKEESDTILANNLDINMLKSLIPKRVVYFCKQKLG